MTIDKTHPQELSDDDENPLDRWTEDGQNMVQPHYLGRKRRKKRRKKHGMSGTRAYRAWVNACARVAKRKIYRWRGMCERWWYSPSAFVADMGPCPEGLTLERMDNDKGYYPGNCCWATPKVNAGNTGRNHVILYEGRKRILAGLAEEFGMPWSTLRWRLDHKWSIDKALKAPTRASGNKGGTPERLLIYRGRALGVRAWGRERGIPPRTILDRLKSGLTTGQALEFEEPPKRRGRPVKSHRSTNKK